MSEETTAIDAVKTVSDGTVTISVELYNELVEKVAEQKGSLRDLNDQLLKARSAPPTVNRTVVNKTAEMVAQDHRVWGGSLMGLGATLFVIGALRYRTGKS